MCLSVLVLMLSLWFGIGSVSVSVRSVSRPTVHEDEPEEEGGYGCFKTPEKLQCELELERTQSELRESVAREARRDALLAKQDKMLDKACWLPKPNSKSRTSAISRLQPFL